jgi:hypothetical protein
MSSEIDLSRNQALQNKRNSFSREFPLPFNVETLQAFGALFQIPQYYRKFLYYKTKMLCNYVINIKFHYKYSYNSFTHFILILLLILQIEFSQEFCYQFVWFCYVGTVGRVTKNYSQITTLAAFHGEQRKLDAVGHATKYHTSKRLSLVCASDLS